MKSDIREKYDLLSSMLRAVYEEIKEFSKKKQDELLNEIKVKKINKLLVDLKEFLKDQPSSNYLDLLDNDKLPSYSDAVLIISQYNSAMNLYWDKIH